MPSFLKKLSNNKKNNSLANRLRRKRFALFFDMIREMPRPIRIIDVGGTELFWKQMGYTEQPGIEITLLNLKSESTETPGFRSMAGDARNMKQFGNKEFDLAFSNSVIEHVGSFREQSQMAAEMQRIAKKIYLQTPNYFFPLEPHFLFPLFQFLPLWLKVWLIMNFSLGWYPKITNNQKAIEICLNIRLLKKSELQTLFAGSKIHKEYFAGLVKSFIVIQHSTAGI